MSKFHWLIQAIREKIKKESLHIKKISKRDQYKKRITKRYHYLGDQYPHVYFTEREIDIVKLILNNLTYQQIAQNLNLSVRTIEYYVRQMKLKLMYNRTS
ncbi:MAG: hypothetical protein A3F17_09030 [Gammaproteobacteria bacterium RIFCSPHIGHO2_12_FULL_41_15]|nr:MAG: hypothetical protein A3F17_09030 [Gammaproteobacteria bacterium RIFCSPHIGHO2_12_FULL_41_15]